MPNLCSRRCRFVPFGVFFCLQVCYTLAVSVRASQYGYVGCVVVCLDMYDWGGRFTHVCIYECAVGFLPAQYSPPRNPPFYLFSFVQNVIMETCHGIICLSAKNFRGKNEKNGKTRLVSSAGREKKAHRVCSTTLWVVSAFVLLLLLCVSQVGELCVEALNCVGLTSVSLPCGNFLCFLFLAYVARITFLSTHSRSSTDIYVISNHVSDKSDERRMPEKHEKIV